MDRIKRITALFAALACAALCACGYLGGSDTAHDAEAVSKAQPAEGVERVPFTDLTGEEILCGFPAYDMQGYAFTVMTSSPNRFIPEEEAAGILNPVIAERNALLEKKYNFTIKEVYCKESDFLSKLSASVAAGKQLADAVSFARAGVSAAAAGNLLMNLYSVPYLQTDMSYLDRGLIEKCTAKNELYVIYEPSSLFYSDLMCVVYNRALIGSEYDVIYKPVKEGTWSGEMMLSLAEAAAPEVMNKRSPDSVHDVFGIVSLYERAELIHESFVASGYSLFGSTFHKEIEYSADLDTADKVANEISAIYGSKCFMNADTDTAAKAFREGRAAFAVCRLGFITTLESSSLDWGVAPFPKLCEGQEEYYSCVSDTACGISVPERQEDPERTGKCLTLLFAASCAGVEDALTDNLMTFTMHDNADALLLRRVFDNPVTDMALLYYQGESRLPGVGRETILEAVENGKSFSELTYSNAIALRELNALDFK